MTEEDPGVCKAILWLLVNLTASHHSARIQIASSQGAINRVQHLMVISKDHAVLAARTLGNVARGGPECQSALFKAGTTDRLLACLSAPAVDVQVCATPSSLMLRSIKHKKKFWRFNIKY
jgi:hypothetical protein